MRLKSTFLYALLLGIFISCGSKEEKQPEIPEKPKDSIFYGFNFNHFEVVRDTVQCAL